MNSQQQSTKPLSTVPAIALIGPTAIGKTALSIDLAKRFSCEIIGVDSMQVYRYMDIGTAKIKPEETEGVPHHLIDIVFPDENYDAARFVKDCCEAVEGIRQRGNVPLLTGGTGLYLKALTQGLFDGVPENKAIRKELQERLEKEGCLKLHEELRLCDEDSANRIHPNDSLRIVRGLEIFLASGIPWSVHIRNQKSNKQQGAMQNVFQIGLTCERKTLYERINMRTEIMLEEGLEDEVRGLLEMGYGAELNSMGSIGYRHMLNYIDSTWSYDEMRELLARDTRRYAKRQYTWFNSIPEIKWFEVSNPEPILASIDEWINKQ